MKMRQRKLKLHARQDAIGYMETSFWRMRPIHLCSRWRRLFRRDHVQRTRHHTKLFIRKKK